MDRVFGGTENRIPLKKRENGKRKNITTEPVGDILCFATIEGVVQGVGFRPYVAKNAAACGLHGWVRNAGGRVEILVSGSRTNLDIFFAAVVKGPPQSDIKRFSRTEPERPDFRMPPLPTDGAFLILSSECVSSGLAMPPADLCVCEACLREMDNPADRRYRHPFISCTSCGPRYSILESLPYDRHTTSMADFPMCPACGSEYGSMGDRRHHAQTISCHDCGPQLVFMKVEGPGIKTEMAHPDALRVETILSETVEILRSGGIVAIKGIGGFHLLCDPFRDEAVTRLRILKQRDAKPFAVMFPTLGDIRNVCQVTETEAALLRNTAHPIVLLTPLKEPAKPLSPCVCPGSRHIGALLPYTPLHHLLLRMTGPLVATSANLSGHPIVPDEETMSNWLGKGLDAVLSHSRRIVTPQDDSVAWVVDDAPQLIRRARGYAPLSLPMRSTDGRMVLALGGQQKAGWCLVKEGYALLGEYLGDLSEEEAWLTWNHSLANAVDRSGGKPDRVAIDLHPRYRNRDLPLLTDMPKCDVLPVQHHHAHIAAVMAEHDLEGPVLGVSFDGTGFGSDATMWGGEFLMCRGSDFIRVAALKPILMVGGDNSVEEGWKSLLCHLSAADLPMPPESSVPERDAIVLSALRSRVNTMVSSSMGRLFDAVSALLGFANVSRFEGECAILLEKAASEYLDARMTAPSFPVEATASPAFSIEETAVPAFSIEENVVPAFSIEENGVSAFSIEENGVSAFSIQMDSDGLLLLDPAPVLSGLLKGLQSGTARNQLALAFHQAVACGTMMILDRLSESHGIKTIALSGGVFQNRLLLDMLLPLLRTAGHRVYLHRQVPPNDGGLALGQAFVACRKG